MRSNQTIFLCLMTLVAVGAILGGQFLLYRNFEQLHKRRQNASLGIAAAGAPSHEFGFPLAGVTPPADDLDAQSSSESADEPVRYFPFPPAEQDGSPSGPPHAAVVAELPDVKGDFEGPELIGPTPTPTPTLTPPAFVDPTSGAASADAPVLVMSNPQPEGVPDRLLSTEDAAPIQERATDSASEDQWRRALIDEELPNATPEERKIWSEELQGLPLEAVRDILRMRRKVSPGFPQIGELPAILVPAPPEEHFDVYEPSTDDLFASERQLFDNLAGGIPAMVTDIHSAQCVILNNIANAGTHGFKRSQVFFEDLHYDNVRFAGIADGNGQLTATGLSIGWGSRLATTVVDHSQGPFAPSDQPLHVAIEGSGFFQVNDGSQILYTRCGRFCLDADGHVVLSSAQRGRLLEPAICIPPEAVDLTVAADGRVSYSLPGVEPRQDAGQFQLAHFVNPQGLEQRGECLFAQTVASGAARIGNPGEEGRGELRSGQLEQSNVTIQCELAELQRLRRQSKALHTAVRLIEPETTLLPVPTRYRPAPNEPGVAAGERSPVVAPRMAQEILSHPRRQ